MSLHNYPIYTGPVANRRLASERIPSLVERSSPLISERGPYCNRRAPASLPYALPSLPGTSEVDAPPGITAKRLFQPPMTPPACRYELKGHKVYSISGHIFRHSVKN
uniref:Uncharacterized protein n=1 Tax=Glossina pallidipes TaxID=7398 RepID=A0A1B0A411_GLOPL